ncbi:MAG: hypothetical protein GX241_05650 [Ruminococcaceae bacterium]|nr:hypothetical protein [Oscillospiraceae bacterium]
MKTKVRKRSAPDVLKGHLISLSFFTIVFGFFLGGIASAEKNAATEGKRVLEESVNKAVISCYALEGAYPSSIKYLEDNYGLTYDKEKYAIGYIAFASNIMPEITVINLNPSEEEEEKIKAGYEEFDDEVPEITIE